MVKRSKVIIVCTMFLLSLSICGCGGLAGKLEKTYDQYNNGEISYEQASEKLDKFRELADGSEAQSKIDEQENELIELRASKYAFDAAGQSMTDGNYETALSQYERVIEKDTNYEAAQTGIDTAGQKYLETVHEQGKAYVDDGDYQKAIKYYDASERVYDDGSAATWITETNAEYKTNLENKLAEYSKNKEYQEAIVCCDELRDYFGDDSYGTKRLELENAWSDQVLVDSEKLLSEEEYAEASSMVKIAMTKVTDTGALQEQLDRITMYTPVDVTTLDGCFGYLSSPMMFEAFILDALINAENIEDWKQRLHDNLGTYSGDDYTFGLMAFGFESFIDMKNLYSERYKYIADIAQRFESADEGQKEKIWNEYAANYYKYYS